MFGGKLIVSCVVTVFIVKWCHVILYMVYDKYYNVIRLRRFLTTCNLTVFVGDRNNDISEVDSFYFCTINAIDIYVQSTFDIVLFMCVCQTQGGSKSPRHHHRPYSRYPHFGFVPFGGESFGATGRRISWCSPTRVLSLRDTVRRGRRVAFGLVLSARVGNDHTQIHFAKTY